MDTLSSPRSQLRDRYDAVVVGSGYGGGVLASRLARAGLCVAVLERGQERHPGQFPTTLMGALRAVQVHTRRRDVGASTSLFDFRFSGDVGVLIGCGLGGTSLINANVALKATDEVFSRDRWPEALRGSDRELDQGYLRAHQMLGSSPYADPPLLPKRTVLAEAADMLGYRYLAPPINVRSASGRNAAGVDQPACSNCGDCVTGCNVGAKNTVLVTYLADAVAHGAEVFTELAVRTVTRAAPGPDVGPDTDAGPEAPWRVTCTPTGRPGAPRVLRAGIVVLGAGALGSTEILLRSRDAGLPVSGTLGQAMSGNGDFLAFAYDTTERIDGMGAGAHVDPVRPVGPCITGAIDLRSTSPGAGGGMLIEEGSIPSPLVPLMPIGLLLSSLRGRRAGVTGSRPQDLWQVAAGLLRRRPREAAAHTQTFLAMGTDEDRGELTLRADRPVVDWPDAADQRALFDDDATLAKVAGAMGGTYLRSPVWRSPLGDKYLTVHPLGGCDMADDAEHGVVDDKGRVFAGEHGTVVHDGLYVVDGAIVPTSLGTNPSLTITALAERIAKLAVQDRGLAWQPDPVTTRFTHPVGPLPPIFSFREHLSGSLTDATGTPTPIDLRLEMETDRVTELLADLAEPMTVHGTVIAPALAPDPLIASGTLRILVADPESGDQSTMRDRLKLDAPDGRRFVLHATKFLRDDRGIDVWRDTTTASVVITRGDHPATDTDAEIVATGIVQISLRDFLRLVASLRVDNMATRRKLGPIVHFGRRFARSLLATYGKVLATPEDFKSIRAVVPPVRALRLPEPERRWCGPDGQWTDTPPPRAWLRLTRYHGGGKGPVLVAPGFAMATSQFLLTTVPINLTEYLVEAGYDVWLFDYRASIDLPSSRTDFTLDDVATIDWPTAIDEVRRITDQPDVQIVAHCVGSMTALMAVLAGAEGVRSIVSSQVTVHPVMHWSSRLKAWVHLPNILADFGLRTVEFDRTPSGREKLLDVALRINPLLRGERCHLPSCRWVFGFFGPTHHHDRLDAITHAATTSLFGVGDVRALAHIGVIVRHGHAVDFRGADVYLPMVHRLAIPITFLAGDRNRIFFPDGSARTIDWLREHNDPGLYQRIVLPEYAHLDTLIGKEAHVDVFPHILRALDTHACTTSPAATSSGVT